MKIQKQIWKRGVSLFLVLCMLVGLYNGVWSLKDVKAEESANSWTFSDAGIANGKVAAGSYGAVQLGGKNVELDGSQFRGYVTFHALNTVNMWGWDTSHLILGTDDIAYGGETLTGVHFAVEQSGTTTYLVCGAYTESGNNAKKHTFENIPIALGTETLLEISFDYSVNSADSSYHDLKLTVSANGQTEEVTIEKQCASTLTAYASVFVHSAGNANNTITARSAQAYEKEYTKWTFSDAGIADGKVTAGSYGTVQLDGENVKLDGSQFRGYVTFHALNTANMWGWDTSHLILGTNDTAYGGETLAGVHFALEQSGEATYLVCGAYTEGGNNAKKHTFENIPIALGTETLLEISFDYSVNGADNSYNDLKLTVSANGQTEEVTIEKQCATTTNVYASVFVHSTGDANNTITARSVQTPIKEYTKWTFNDAGIAEGKVAAGTYGAVQLNGSNVELGGSQFRGYITFHALNAVNMWGWDSSHLVLGTNTITEGQTTTGIHFAVEQSGEATYLVCGAYTEGGNNAKKHTFENIPIVLGTETLLEISFDYSVNSTDSSYYDLKLTVSASEKTEQVVIEKQRPSTTTAYASVYVDGTGDANNTITARSVREAIETSKSPEEYGYEQVTFLKDFGINNGTYTQAGVGSIQKYAQYTDETLNGKYLDVNLTMANGVQMKYAGTSPDYGLQIWVGSGNLYICDTTNWIQHSISPSKFEMTTFENTEFKLWCSLEYVAADEDGQVNDVKVGIWINKIFEQFYTFNDCVGVDSGFANYVSFLLNDDSKSVTVYSPIDISYNHYGIANQTVKGKTVRGTTAESKTILDGIFSGNVQFPKDDAATYLNVGGLKLSYADQGISLELGNESVQITEEEAERTLAGKLLAMKLKFVSAGTDDVKIEVYFDDVLYKEHTFVGGAKLLDNTLVVHSETQPIIVGHASETLDETLTKLTFSKFGIPDGTYSVDTVKGIAVSGEYKASLDGTVFSGDVCFSDKPKVWLNYAGTDEWSGLRFKSNGNGTLTIERTSDAFNIVTFNSDLAGVQLTDYEYNLKISLQYVDSDVDGTKDDVKLGVWFNDMLYNNEYVYVKNLASELGSYLGVYADNAESFLKVASVELGEKKESLSAHLKKITLKNFSIEDGRYAYTEEGTGKKGVEASGGYAFTLNGTVFSADVEFSSAEGAELRYGGGESMWHGLVFRVMSDGRIRLNDAMYSKEDGDKLYYFESSIAGVKLTDNMFNLKLSTEYVDSDGDGAKDDVKFGVWFNDVLYNNEYIYFTDYALEMGSNLSILSVKTAPKSYLHIKSDTSVYTGVDFSIYGFTKNWDKELGEEL